MSSRIINPQRSATLTLILINAGIFLALYPLIIFKPSWLPYVALTPSDALQGRYLWTFLTSMFMHGGVFHIFANMMSLTFLGGFLERLIGHKRFLGLYFASGLVAGLFYVAVSAITGDVNVPAVGASGAIFGLAGMLAVLTPRLPVYILFIPIAMPMWFGVILIMFGLWAVSAAANLPIGNTAHLGGLVTGLAYALYLRVKYKKKAEAIRNFYDGFKKK